MSRPRKDIEEEIRQHRYKLDHPHQFQDSDRERSELRLQSLLPELQDVGSREMAEAHDRLTAEVTRLTTATGELTAESKVLTGATRDLRRATRKLDWTTWVLIVFTVALFVATAVLAFLTKLELQHR